MTKVQTLRARLEEEKHHLDQALVFHAAEVRPRVERAVGLRAQLVRAIGPFFDDRRLKRGDRTVLRAILAEQLDDILMHVVPDPDLQRLFERLHGIAYAQAVQEDLDEVRPGMAADVRRARRRCGPSRAARGHERGGNRGCGCPARRWHVPRRGAGRCNRNPRPREDGVIACVRLSVSSVSPSGTGTAYRLE